MPIISKINNSKLNIVNNECFTIKKIKDDNIHISSEFKDDIIIHKDEFQETFYLAYSITIHSSQGETFNESYTMYDWNLIDERLRYVAETRASDISYINIF